MDLSHILTGIIIGLGVINLARMGLFMIGSDVQDMRRHRRLRRTGGSSHAYRPTISVLIPAHNEEAVIIRAIASVYRNPYARKEVIVIDDGSSDRTAELVGWYRHRYQLTSLRLLRQTNQGKAEALNNGIAQARGELIMVLDADSALSPTALAEVTTYFQDPEVVMAASNVKIMPGRGLLNLAQRFEYLVGHRVKRSLTTYNCEYIVGGVGSTFRRAHAVEIGGYDTNTITEDIDFTLKMIRDTNLTRKVVFAASVVTHTEAVLTFSQLIRQRFRWKYGRLQAFLKNHHLFFSTSSTHDRRLTWLNLPFALYSELAFLLEPLMIGFIIYTSIHYHNLWTFLSAYAVMTSYIALNVIAESTNSVVLRLKLLALTPVAYPLLLIVGAAEYCASLQVLAKLGDLLRRRHTGSSWQHVTRAGRAVASGQTLV